MTEILQSTVDLIGAHPHLAILIVFLVATGEALVVVGLFVPSTLVLVSAGTLVGMGKLDFVPIFLATTLGAIAGDAISFWVGHVWKHRIKDFWPFSRYTSLLDRGETFFARHGAKSVFIGRFIPAVKSVIPGIAGIVGMDPVRFTIINCVSAVVWAAVHLLPGVGLGRGINVAHSGNPRLLVLLLIVAVCVILAWFAVRVAFEILLPHAARWQLVLVSWLMARNTGWSRWAMRLITNQDGLLVLFGYATVALLGLAGFGVLALDLLLDPELAGSDEAISGYLQTLRHHSFDRFAVAVTMLGDGVMLTTLSVALVGILLLVRRWRLAVCLVVAFTAAALFVPVMKSLLHRARPTGIYEGAQAFSFPSGHATLATAVLGITALVVARGLGDRHRKLLYLATAVAIVLIGFSRIYLLAHWPSDVLAGVLFGAALVFVMAFLLHGRTLGRSGPTVAVVIGCVLLVVYPAHLYRGYSREQAKYAVAMPIVTHTVADWLGGEWASVALARVPLDGEVREPMLVQSVLGLDSIASAALAAGWQAVTPSLTDGLIAAVLPSRAALSARAVLPFSHLGRQPLAVFVKSAPADAGKRLVLRVWKTGHAIRCAEAPRMIVSLSVSGEEIEHLAFGFSVLESTPLPTVRAAGVAAGIAAVLGAPASLHRGDAGTVWIVAPATPC